MDTHDTPRFHLAIPVLDLEKSRAFYGGLLGCTEGRSDARWVDFDLAGHQLVCHVVEQMPASPARNRVDGDAVPVPHFGLVFSLQEWQALADRLQKAGTRFEIEPRIRFRGQPGEQGTFFLFDPSGNALEFKGFADMSALFAR